MCELWILLWYHGAKANIKKQACCKAMQMVKPYIYVAFFA